MRIKKLITKRRADLLSYWDVVLEWEDELSRELGCELYNECPWVGKPFFEKFISRFPRLYFLVQTTRPTFVFEMSDWRFSGINNFSNVVPCIIDAYPNRFPVEIMRYQYRRNKIVFFTSRQVYDYYVSKKLNFKVFHLAVSISSKYAVSPTTVFDKKYDAAIVGRPNPVLYRYLMTYAESHPDFTYVFHDGPKENHKFYYKTNKGDCLGELDTREKYMGLMRQVRVGLYSTSGMDGDKFLDDNESIDTAQYHQVTPRFLEMIACGCHIMARYESNSDTIFFEMEMFCKSIESYNDFECRMDRYLSMSPNMERYSQYLRKHYTSQRAIELASMLKAI